MEIYTPSGDSGLFNLLGKLFALARSLDTARGGSVQTKLAALRGVLDLCPEAEPVISGETSWEEAGGSLQSQISTVAWRLIRRYILEKNLNYRSQTEALQQIRADLVQGGYYFTASTQNATVTPNGSNQGDCLLAVDLKNGRGEPVFVYPETWQVTAGERGLTIAGQPTAGRTERTWPGGSGVYLSLLIRSVSQSLLTNADFEALMDTDQPAGWTIHTGTPGQTVRVTSPEVQQVTLSGSPTGGYFILTWTDPDGKNWQTETLAPTCTATDIQNALRRIPGLERVTVSGTNPWTVTCEGTPGDINQLGVINRLTGGTSPQVSVSTTQAGDVLSYSGRSLKLVGNGSEQTLLHQSLELKAGQPYVLFARLRRTASAAGEVRFELRRSVSDTALADSAGNLNRLSVNLSSISSSGHTGLNSVFCLPADYSGPVYFVIHAASPINSGQAVAIDQLVLVEGTRAYSGGPWVAAATGRKPFQGDRWTVTLSNNLAGVWQATLARFLRWYELVDRPPPTTGSTLIPDSLLS
jgi:hypothetical protein